LYADAVFRDAAASAACSKPREREKERREKREKERACDGEIVCLDLTKIAPK
jgi:hypothetical protein